MDILYDPKYNIAYIKLRERSGNVKTLHVSEEVNIDMSPDGKIYGIELLNANAQLRATKKRNLVFTNKSSGKTTKIPLPAR